MDKNTNKEEVIKELERSKRFKDGVKILAVVGIGAGYYGFKLGRKIGYTNGVKDGYVTASNEMISAWREIAEEMRASRGN